MTKVSTSGWAWMIGGAAAAGVSALALGAGYLWWQQQKTPIPVPQVETASEPVPEQPQPQVAVSDPEPEVAAETVQAPAPEPEVASEEAPSVEEADVAADASGASVDAPVATVLSAPVLDVVRVDAEGAALVAGSGQVGSVVIVLLDDTEVSRAEIGPNGEFVIFLAVPPGEKAQVLSLRAELDGQARASEESFILAPVAAPAPQVALKVEEENTAQAPAEVGTEVAAAEVEDTQIEAASEAEVVPTPEVKVAGVAEAASEDAQSDVSTITAQPEETVAEDAVEAVSEATPAAEVPVAVAEDAPQDAGNATSEAEVAAASADNNADASEPSPEVAVNETSAAAPEIAIVEETEAEPAEVTAPVVATKEPAPTVPPAPEVGTQIAVLKADETGLSLVQPAAPTAPELVGQVVLDTISYTPAGEVLLKGRSRPAALVRVYLDNAPVAEISSGGDGSWDAELLDVVPGIYTLRLDEIEPTVGRVLSRIETPFKRETPDVLAQTGAVDGSPDQPRLQAVTVQQGDTLWAISDTVYGDGLLYVRVFAANRDQIRNPDLIYPGQIFNLPE